MKHTAYIALGSNVGDHRDTLNRAMVMLDESPDIELVRLSRFIDTGPVGPPQGRYTNAAARLDTDLSPHELLDKLNAVEAALGRDRSREQRWGPRSCDLDIIFYDDIILDDQRLTIPHRLMHTRLFVLVPLDEIAPDVVHPQTGLSVRQMLSDLQRSGTGEDVQ